MSSLVAALPMYDWPEARREVDAEWEVMREKLRAAGFPAPQRLARRNADLPSVPGGIRDDSGTLIAPDPATLPPDEFDLPTLWRHPDLLIAQTCWGPLEMTGLAAQVRVVGQPDYSDFEGGDGTLYSSAILVRRADAEQMRSDSLPISALRGRRLAFNEPASMSGFLALQRDLHAIGAGMEIFATTVETGSHRASIRAVAEGSADLCAIDCRTWSLARRFEAAASSLVAIGWTAKRPGLPLITRQIESAASIAAALEEIRNG